MNNNYNFWFWLSAVADMAQLQSYEMLLRDANNNDLMRYLKHQDSDLLEKIINQNEVIIRQNQEILDIMKGENKVEMELDLEECIERITENGNIEDMHKLADMLEDTLEILEKENPDRFKEYKMELYEMAYGKTINRQMAEEIVSHMKPYRMRWTFEDIEQILNQYGIDGVRVADFYVVMNSAYNDYRDLFGEDIESYIKFTMDFINDEDAKDGKVFRYFTTIPR